MADCRSGSGNKDNNSETNCRPRNERSICKATVTPREGTTWSQFKELPTVKTGRIQAMK